MKSYNDPRWVLGEKQFSAPCPTLGKKRGALRDCQWFGHGAKVASWVSCGKRRGGKLRSCPMPSCNFADGTQRQVALFLPECSNLFQRKTLG